MSKTLKLPALPTTDQVFQNTTRIRAFLKESNLLEFVSTADKEHLKLNSYGEDAISEAIMSVIHRESEDSLKESVLSQARLLSKSIKDPRADEIELSVSTEIDKHKQQLRVALTGKRFNSTKTIDIFGDSRASKDIFIKTLILKSKSFAWFLDDRSPFYSKDTETSMLCYFDLKNMCQLKLSSADKFRVKEMFSFLLEESLKKEERVPEELIRAEALFAEILKNSMAKDIYYDADMALFVNQESDGAVTFQKTFVFTSKTARPFTYVIGVRVKDDLKLYSLGAKSGSNKFLWADLFGSDFAVNELIPKVENIRYLLNFFGYRRAWFVGEQLMMRVINLIPVPNSIEITGKDFKAKYVNKTSLGPSEQTIYNPQEYRYNLNLNALLSFFRERNVEINGELHFVSRVENGEKLKVSRWIITNSVSTKIQEEVSWKEGISFDSNIEMTFSPKSKISNIELQKTRLLDVVSGSFFINKYFSSAK